MLGATVQNSDATATWRRGVLYPCVRSVDISTGNISISRNTRSKEGDLNARLREELNRLD
jgi:hypothetical protein